MSSLQCTNPSLWMGDLDPFMDEGVIRNAFSQMGHTVQYIKFLIDKKTSLPAAYCFVDFGEIQLAKSAFQGCNGMKMPGVFPVKKFKLNYAFSGGWATKEGGSPLASHGDFSIHVSNLSPDVTDEQLHDYFNGSGRFKSVKNSTVVRDGSVSRGYGFVRFMFESDVLEAIRLFNGAVGLGSKAIRVGRATPFTPKSNSQPPYPQQQQQQQQGSYPPTQQYYQTPQQQSAHLSAQYDSGYGASYHQYKESSTTETTKVVKESGDAPTSTTDEDEDEDDPLVDPEITIDVEKSNRLILERSEEFYQALDESRWQVVDSITMTYDDLCKA